MHGKASWVSDCHWEGGRECGGSPFLYNLTGDETEEHLPKTETRPTHRSAATFRPT